MKLHLPISLSVYCVSENVATFRIYMSGHLHTLLQKFILLCTSMSLVSCMCKILNEIRIYWIQYFIIFQPDGSSVIL
jgi:hypothetical protein